MGGRDHACEGCGRGGFNDPDGVCICSVEPAPPSPENSQSGRSEPGCTCQHVPRWAGATPQESEPDPECPVHGVGTASSKPRTWTITGWADENDPQWDVQDGGLDLDRERAVGREVVEVVPASHASQLQQEVERFNGLWKQAQAALDHVWEQIPGGSESDVGLSEEVASLVALIASLEAEVDNWRSKWDGQWHRAESMASQRDDLLAGIEAALNVLDNDYSKAEGADQKAITYVTPRDPRSVLIETRDRLKSLLSDSISEEGEGEKRC